MLKSCYLIHRQTGHLGYCLHRSTHLFALAGYTKLFFRTPLGKTFGMTLSTTLSKTLSKTFGTTLSTTLSETLSETFGMAFLLPIAYGIFHHAYSVTKTA